MDSMDRAYHPKKAALHGDPPPPYFPPQPPPPYVQGPPQTAQIPMPMPPERISGPPSGLSPIGPPVLYLIEDVRVRHCFILKVYLILFLQLAIVAGVTAALLMIGSLHEWMRENTWMYITALCVFLVVYILIICCKDLRRQWPWNLIILIIFTLATAYMTAVLASHFNGWTVLIAAGVTTGMCLLVSLFALQTWVDLTGCIGIMSIITLAVCLTGIFLTIIHFRHPDFEILNAVYSGIVAVIFVGWLAIDTQLLMGNKEHALSPDDYIFAALQLFVDIIYIFWHLLIVIGHIRGE